MAVNTWELYPCFEYYGQMVRKDKEKSGYFVKNLARAYKKCGVPEDMISAILCMQYAYSTAGIDAEEIFEALRKEDMDDCKAYAEMHYGKNYDGIYSDFCRVCPVCTDYVEGQDVQEYSVISRLLRMPYEEGVAVISGKDIHFFSYVSLNKTSICGTKLSIPCVVPMAQIVYDCLMENDRELYKDLSGLEESPNAELVKVLAKKVIDVITNGLGEQTFLNESLGCTVIGDYIKNTIFGTEPMGDAAFESYIMTYEDYEEADIEADMPDFEQELAMMQEEVGKTEQEDISVEETEPIGVESEEVWPEMEGNLESEYAEEVDEGIFDFDSLRESELVAEEKEEDKEAETLNEEIMVSASDAEAGDEETEQEDALVEEVSLDEFPYFDATVEVTRGGWLSQEDELEYVPVSERRFKIPFASNDDNSISAERNVILHQEIHSAALSRMIDLVSDDRADRELDALQEKVRKDSCMAVEIVYVTDQERYILLLWNAATRRFNYVPIIDKADGKLKPIPYEVLQALRSEKRKIICYQPYLLCGISGLYDGKVETKNVHSIYSHYKVLMKDSSFMIEDILGSYLYAAEPKVAEEIEKYKKMYGDYGYFLTIMPFYRYIQRLQFSYASATSMDGLCASQQKKDIMYGYSYLAAGIYPMKQRACFKLLPNNRIVYEEKMVPCISYVPGYIMEFVFANIDSDESELKVEDNVKNNQKARRLLLKELAKQKAAFYHGDLKLLYLDDYKIVFYVTHTYRAVHKTDITRILMHETYRHKISSNQLWAKFWGTSLNVVRYVNKH